MESSSIYANKLQKIQKKEKREERKKEDSRIAKPTRLQKIFT